MVNGIEERLLRRWLGNETGRLYREKAVSLVGIYMKMNNQDPDEIMYTLTLPSNGVPLHTAGA